MGKVVFGNWPVEPDPDPEEDRNPEGLPTDKGLVKVIESSCRSMTVIQVGLMFLCREICPVA